MINYILCVLKNMGGQDDKLYTVCNIEHGWDGISLT